MVPALAWGAGAATGAPPAPEAIEAGRWALLIAIAGLFLGLPLLLFIVSLVSLSPKIVRPDKLVRGLVVGSDNRVSTSKAAAAVWTYAVASALLSLVIAKWLGYGEGLTAQEGNGLQSTYGLLVGGPIGAAILAKGIVTSQIESGTDIKTTGSPDASQLVNNDRDETDLGDLQYVLFNTVALVFFFGEFLRVPTSGLPNLPELLVGLTSVSAIGYLGKKVLRPSGPAITSVSPESAAVGAEVKIGGPGLIEAQNAPEAVHFDNVAGTPVTVRQTPAGAVVVVNVPPGVAGDDVTLKVKTIKGVEAEWDKRFRVVAANPDPTPPEPSPASPASTDSQ